MQLTTNFRLRKPEGTDPVDVQDFNDNADVIDGELAKKLDKTGVGSDLVTAFSQAAGRTNLSSGEKLSTSLGKVMKWFTDLKTVAFSGSYADLSNKPTIPSGAAGTHGVANNCATTAANYVLDARQGTALQNNINQVNSNLSAGLNGCKVSYEGGSFYATNGSVKKKLGDGIIYLGQGTSFSLNGYEKYNTFTTDNFIVGIISGNVTLTSFQEFNLAGKAEGFSIVKNYDAYNGILTITGNSQRIQSWDIMNYSRSNATQVFTCFAYLVL